MFGRLAMGFAYVRAGTGWEASRPAAGLHLARRRPGRICLPGQGAAAGALGTSPL